MCRSADNSVRRASPRSGGRLLCCTLAALVLIDLTVRAHSDALARYDPHDRAGKLRSYVRGPEGRVVCMGSSRAAYALVPGELERVLERSAFNLALSATKPPEWETICRDVLSRRPPSLVILGVNAGELNAKYVPTEGASAYFGFRDVVRHARWVGFNRDLLQTYALATLGRGWALYGRRYEVRTWIDEQLGRVSSHYGATARRIAARREGRFGPDGYDHPWLAGHSLRTLTERLADHQGVHAAEIPVFEPLAPSMRCLHGVLDWFADRDIPLAVVYVPNSPRAQERWRAVEPLVQAVIAAMCRQRGVPFIRPDVPMSDDEFVDETHMGLDLAYRFSAALAQELAGRTGLRLPSSRVACVAP